MKKIALIFIFAGFSLISAAQDLTTEIAKKVLPTGNEKINENDAKLHVTQRFHRGNNMISSMNPDHIYRLGDVLIVLNSAQSTEKPEPLPTLKRGIDAMYKNDTSYKSILSTINGNIVLTTNQILDDVGCYMIFCNSSTNSKYFKALIRYNISDNAKAEKIVNHITENLRF